MLTIKQCDSIDSSIDKEYDKYFEFYLDGNRIGVAAIATNSDNMIYMYIYEKYRGNNWGKEAFDLLLQKLKELSVDTVSLIIDNRNMQMIRIISHKQYMIVSRGENFKCYEIKI